jgi:hypothetical protein
MKVVSLTGGVRNGSAIIPLRLPVLHRDGPIDAVVYRRRAAGEEPPLVYDLDRSAGLRTIAMTGQIADGAVPDIAGSTERALTIVTAGQLRITAGTQDEYLERGDLVLICAEACESANFWCSEGTMLLQLALDGNWPEDGLALPDEANRAAQRRAEPNFQRLYRADAARSYFRDFSELFAAPAGEWSHLKPVDGFRFMSFPDGGFIDWHPEIVNNLAVVLAGVTELEAADGVIEHFHPGDVCLAEDRTGEGHIDRFHGFSVLALIEIATEQLW